MTPVLRQIAVDSGELEAHGASVALKGAPADHVDDPADRIAVAVGCRGLDHFDVGDARRLKLSGIERPTCVTRVRHAVAVDLKRIVRTGNAANVKASGRTVLVFVHTDARQALERLADIPCRHRAERLLRNDVNDAGSNLLLVDGEGLATSGLLHHEGIQLEDRALHRSVQRRHAASARGHGLTERIQADVIYLDGIRPSWNGH